MSTFRFTTLLLFTTSIIYGQSPALHLLLGNAELVYKGTVIQAEYEDSDIEGDRYHFITKIDSVYIDKTGPYIDWGISGDTVDFMQKVNHKTLIADSTYIFFVRDVKTIRQVKSEEFTLEPPDKDGLQEIVEIPAEYRYAADPVSQAFEGISFSPDLERAIFEISGSGMARFEKNIDHSPFLETMTSFSPVVEIGQIIQVDKTNNPVLPYDIFIKRDSTDTLWLLKAASLRCACVENTVHIGTYYYFFMSPVDEHTFILTDRWLGIFQPDPEIPAFLYRHPK